MQNYDGNYSTFDRTVLDIIKGMAFLTMKIISIIEMIKIQKSQSYYD